MASLCHVSPVLLLPLLIGQPGCQFSWPHLASFSLWLIINKSAGGYISKHVYKNSCKHNVLSHHKFTGFDGHVMIIWVACCRWESSIKISHSVPEQSLIYSSLAKILPNSVQSCRNHRETEKYCRMALGTHWNGIPLGICQHGTWNPLEWHLKSIRRDFGME